MFWTIFNCVASLFVVMWIAFRIINRHVIQLCSAIPVAQPYYPVLGNILIFACPIDRLTSKLFTSIQQGVSKGHRALCFWFSVHPIIVIIDPDDIKKVLMNSVRRGKEMEESSSEYSKYGLLTAPVDYWKVTRRHLNLSFHPRNLEQLMGTFNSTSKQLVTDLSRLVDGSVNLMPHVMSAALRTMCIFLYGPRILQLVSTEQFENLCHAMELFAELIAIRNTKPWLKNRVLFKLFYSKEINMIKTTLDEIFQIANSKSKDEAVEKGTQGFQTIMQAMRQLQEKVESVTDEHVFDEMSSFFATGTDSIGATVSSSLLALAKFPHIQDKVYEEICSVVSEDKEQEEEVTCVNLKQLTYLEQVIKETLRFFSVVPMTSRAPGRDLDLGGYTIPANKMTGLCLIAVYFHPKYFPDPYIFDPDRFSTPNSSEDVFMPFSRGPRNCIGKEYAMMLMKVMVVHVVRKFKLSTNMDLQNLRKKYMITLTNCDGYNVFLEKRTG